MYGLNETSKLPAPVSLVVTGNKYSLPMTIIPHKFDMNVSDIKSFGQNIKTQTKR